MGRLTVFSRFLITILIVGGIFFGVKKFLPQLGGGGTKTETTNTNNTADTEDRGTTTAPSNTPNTATSGNAAPSSSPANTAARPSFDFVAPEPEGGKLKGVVELGASGFNSFIIKVDGQKNWKLQKSEFGNSLVIENMATDDDIRIGLKKYIAGMLDYGVNGREIHFVVSSGALKADVTQKIINVLKSMGYVVNTVTPEQEGRLGMKSALPRQFESNSFFCDIGSGNTKVAWTEGGNTRSFESYGAKYFQNNTSDDVVANDINSKSAQIPAGKRSTCFIIGGAPFDMAKGIRNGKERYTVLNAPDAYKVDNAKAKAGVNIYRALANATGCERFVFDWDANFTIGFLLGMN
jgi:hypothetical protein